MTTLANVKHPEHKVQSRREMGDRKCSKGFILNLLRLNFCRVVQWGFQKEITLNVKKKKNVFSHLPLGVAYSLPTANAVVAVLSGE